MDRDRLYLEYIQESIDLVEQYARDGELAFFSDQRTQDAVLRRMETLADAASHLSVELRTRHPDIPWRQVMSFRNVLAHAYWDIRLDRVWQAITADLPSLKAAVDHELYGS